MRILKGLPFGRHPWVAAFVSALLIFAAADVTPAQAEGDEWLQAAFASKSAPSRRSNLGATEFSKKSTNRSRSSEGSSSGSSKGVRVASLGNSYVPKPTPPRRSLSGGGGVNWVANSGCLASNLRSVIHSVASNYGSVTVSSTCRSKSHNARVGGAPRSHHMSGDAADFRVHGNWGAAMAYIRGQVGGFKHYGGGLFHIDNGASRSW